MALEEVYSYPRWEIRYRDGGNVFSWNTAEPWMYHAMHTYAEKVDGWVVIDGKTFNQDTCRGCTNPAYLVDPWDY